MVNHQAHEKYTIEFKLEAVRQVKYGQAISIVLRVLNVPKANPGNWVRIPENVTEGRCCAF